MAINKAGNQPAGHNFCGQCGAPMIKKERNSGGYDRKTGKPNTEQVWICSRYGYNTTSKTHCDCIRLS